MAEKKTPAQKKPGGRGKIHLTEGWKKNTFKERPQDINKKGQPRKAYKTFLEAKEGVDRVNKQSVQDVMKVLFNMTEDELKEVGKDPDMPYSIRAFIEAILNPKTRNAELASWRDWLFGKASQDINVEQTVISPNLKVGYDDENDDDLTSDEDN